MNKKINIVPVFVPHYGCPNDCIFCNQRKITNYDTNIDIDFVKDYIDKYISYFNSKDIKREIAFYGGSFTGIKKEDMIAYLEIANKYIKNKEIDSIRLSTRPDYINREILEILKKYNVETIELGVQSMDDEVLEANNRGHNSQAVICASNLIHEYGFKLGLQMMIGLYKDDYKKTFNTAEKFIELKPEVVRIYPTLVIEETYLETLYKMDEYKPLTLDEAVKRIEPIYALFRFNNINISRIGLQPTDNINEGGSVVAGPFHAAFRQLVEQSIYRYAIEDKIKKIGSIKKLEIFSKGSYTSYIVGNKGFNKKYLMEEYDINKISFQTYNEEDILLIADGKVIKININDFLEKYLQKMRCRYI